MSGGIKIIGGSDIRVMDNNFGGLDYGIDAEDCKNLIVEGNKFSEVTSPVKARNVNGLKALNNIDLSDEQSKHPNFKVRAVTYLVRIYIAELQGIR